MNLTVELNELRRCVQSELNPLERAIARALSLLDSLGWLEMEESVRPDFMGYAN